jgi:hypothetical protein
MRKSLKLSADMFMPNRYLNAFSITMRFGSVGQNYLIRVYNFIVSLDDKIFSILVL